MLWDLHQLQIVSVRIGLNHWLLGIRSLVLEKTPHIWHQGEKPLIQGTIPKKQGQSRGRWNQTGAEIQPSPWTKVISHYSIAYWKKGGGVSQVKLIFHVRKKEGLPLGSIVIKRGAK